MRLRSINPATNGALPSELPRYIPVPAPMIVTSRITQFQAGHLVEMPTICWLLP